jgi:hypothetical protein
MAATSVPDTSNPEWIAFRWCIRALVAVCFLVLAAAGVFKLWGAKVNWANYQRIEPGMTEEEVELLFRAKPHAVMLTTEYTMSSSDLKGWGTSRNWLIKEWRGGGRCYQVWFPVAADEFKHVGFPHDGGRSVAKKNWEPERDWALLDWVKSLMGSRPASPTIPPPAMPSPPVMPVPPPATE